MKNEKKMTYKIIGAESLANYISEIELLVEQVIRKLNTLKNFKLELIRIDEEDKGIK